MRAHRSLVLGVVAVAAVVGAAVTVMPVTERLALPPPASAGAGACDDLGMLPCARQVARATLPVAGSAVRLAYASDRVPGRTQDPAPSAAPIGLAGWTLDVLDTLDPSTTTLVTGSGRLRKVNPVAVSIGAGRYAVAAVDGTSVDVFDAAGRLLSVSDTVTGAAILSCTWTDRGLATLTGPTGARLTVVRDDSGAPVRIDSSSGPRTGLTTRDGSLTAVTYPGGGIARVTADAGGLVTSWADAGGVTTSFGYDAAGRLATSTDGTGATTRYARTVEGATTTVIATGPTGALTRDTVETTPAGTLRSHVDPAGLVTRLEERGTQRILTLPVGRTVTIDLAPDPRWGWDAPVTAAVSADGVATLHEQRTATDPHHPDVGQPTTTTLSVDGAQWRYSYDPAHRAMTTTDPAGRTATAHFNTAGRLIGRTVPGWAAESYDYDPTGRLTAVHLGTGDQQRTWTYTRTPGRTTITDPVGGTQVRTYTPGGNLTETAGPGAGGLTMSSDAAGRLTGFAAAGGAGYRVTRRADGQIAAVSAPAGTGGSIGFTTYDYDQNGRLTATAQPDGKQTLTRDPSGRITTIDSGAGPWTFGYDDGRLTTATGPGAGTALTYAHGALVEQRTTGPFDMAVTRTLDPQGRTATETVAHTSPIGYTYDPAGLLSKAGDLAVARDPATGAVTRETLGSLARTWTYDGFGMPVRETVTRTDGAPVAALVWERDRIGRVTAETITTPGATSTTRYTYDAAGRLTDADRDGQRTRYGYDAAGNRTSVTRPDGTTATATYDARNALVEQDGTRYTYDGAGRLTTATRGTDTTTYHYDRAGALLGVDRPGAPPITYLNDAFGRRIARAVGGTTTGGYVYRDALHPAAEIDPTGAVSTRYVYGDGPAPLYLTKGSNRFLEVVDATGSPVLAVNAADGTIRGALTRDPWGEAGGDTGFQAIGFAGGLTDPDTGLIRFGARDYTPTAAHWTAPDPLGLAGGNPNLYAYVSGDPVNHIDPAGTCEYLSLGVGVSAKFGPWGANLGFGLAAAGSQGGAYVNGRYATGVGGHASIDFTCQWRKDNSDTEPVLDDFSGLGVNGDIGFGTVTFSPLTSLSTRGFGLGFGPAAGVGVGDGATLHWCWSGCPPDHDPESLIREAEREAGCVGVDAGLGLCNPSPDDPLIGSPDDVGPDGTMCSSSGGSTCNQPDPVFGSGGGSRAEPHLVTMDGTHYDMQGVGEYLALAADTGDLEIQTRQQPVPGSRTVSINSMVAMRVAGARIVVTPREPDAIAVRVENAPPVGQGTTTLPHGATLQVGGRAMVVRLADGSGISVVRNPLGLDLSVELTDPRKGHVHGLLGPFGQPGGRVETREGTVIDVTQLRDRDVLYHRFADSWRTSQEQSLLDYAPGQSAATITDLSYPDPAPPLPESARAAAAQLCRHLGITHDPALADCVLDVAATGQAGFADAAVTASGTLPGTPPQPTPSSSGSRIGDGASVTGHIAPGGAPVRYDLDLAGADSFVVADWKGPIGGCDQTFSVNLVDISGNNLPCAGGAVSFHVPDPGTSYTLEIAPVKPGAGDYAFTLVTLKTRDSDITLGPQRHTGRLDARGRIDRFRFAADGATAVRLTDLPPACTPGLTAELFTATPHTFVASRPVCGSPDPVPLPDPTGRYVLQVRSDSLAIGDYAFTLTRG